MLFFSPGISLKIPKPAIKNTPPARPIESVHPGNGSSSEAPIIDGLIMYKGRFFVLCSIKRCSAILLVKVYEFGKVAIKFF